MPWWIFEGIIWFFLIIVGAALIDIVTKNGRKILKQRTLLLAVVVLFFSWSVVFYGSFIESRSLTVKNQSIEIGLSQPLRVVLLSDFHVGPYKGDNWVGEIVKKTNALKPDLVLLLGDYVMGHEGKIEQLAPLQKLETQFGVFAVLGNHDYDAGHSEEIKQTLESFGFKVLVNSSRSITLPDGSVLWLAGVGDLWNDADLVKTLFDLTNSEEVILMSHNPDAVLSLEAQTVDLVVSGHTHGGQISLPWFGPISSVPTIIGKDFGRGYFNIKGSNIFITSGLGETGPRARLFNPPEVVLLELK